ncbi:hypothetical protein EB796_007638 [Bugula neritina]|uniref:Uncharacterized protein n=1 Tax=Bugula neritina TaxID=10212 RepID=A0A7J7K921_BUGNE|nr:hypothetical protein EB796_007638 [Bugula neritina]
MCCCIPEAHDSEISDVKWSSSGKIFATAGVDRKVKIWEVTASHTTQKKGMLTGANSGVMSLDYYSEVSAFYNRRIYANKEKK